MYTMEAKENRKISVAQIKILSASKTTPANSYSNASARVPCKKKASTGVLPDPNQKCKKTPNHSGSQCY